MLIRTRPVRSLALIVMAGAALAACATPAPSGPAAPASTAFNPADFAWSAASGRAAIHGRVAFAPEGVAHACVASAGLTPDTPYTRARFQTLYGSTERAAVPVSVVRSRDVPDPNSDYRSFVRSIPCTDNHFSFTDLPDGSWFVIVPVRAGSAEPIALMQRVQTRAGRPVNVIF